MIFNILIRISKKNMNFYSVFVLFLIIPSTYLSAKPLFNYDAIREKLEDHYYSFNTEVWEQIINDCNKEISMNESSDLLWYYKGFAYHSLGKIVYIPDPEKAEICFDNSIECFEKAIDINYKTEYEALLSSAYGKKASLSSITAIYWGIKSKNSLVDAYENDSLNYKTLLVASIHLMHIPEKYGGDKDQAEELLLKALELNDKKDNSLIWAEDEELYAYLAQLEILKKNKKKARSYMNKALELRPKYDFVLIDLEKQLSSF